MESKTIIFILIILGILITSLTKAQVGIGTNNPDASSGLDLEFTDKGFLPPRLTTTQRNAIADPANGLMIFNITTGCPNYYYGDSWYEWCGMISPSGTIGGLDCMNATIEGTLTEGIEAAGVSASVPYTGGNGQYYTGQEVISTGVTGLTATINSGVFNIGNGTLTYAISGTPSGSGIATFALNIGGQSCDLEVAVAIQFNCGSSTVTFTYNGSSVTYGTVVSTVGECWLDRNLGATQVATSSTDAASYGHLFQWGRLDDGHQVRTSATTTTLSNSDVPGHNMFIKVNLSPWDWRSPQNSNLWQGEGGTNNPCPEGYRLPTYSEWDTERASWISQNAEGAMASPLRLPMAGDRYYFDGMVYGEGSTAAYWSSTTNNNRSACLFFRNIDANMGIHDRAQGMSVRCIKD